MKMTNEEMLKLIREDRPEQVIHEVKSIEKLDKLGWTYRVGVVMEIKLFDIKIKKHHTSLPYPMSEYKKMIDIVKGQK